MPTFCRHNRLLQHCPICAREQQVELEPAITSSVPRTERDRGSRAGGTTGAGSPELRRLAGGRRAGRQPGGGAGLQVRRLERGADDGYRSPLARGLRSSAEAGRLAEELAFATTRLNALVGDPPGLYAEVAGPGEVEERAWLAFLVAYLCPLDEEDPFASVRQARVPWHPAQQPDLGAVRTGPRTAYDPNRPLRPIEAYRAWVSRSGSQSTAFTGDPSWTPERRFTRVFERLALPGFHRSARFDLLVTLGLLGLFELRPGQLMLGGADEVTIGAKRVFGIGDPLMLEGRAAAFARACDLPIAAFDVGLYNWQRGERAHLGLRPGSSPDQRSQERARAALQL